MHRSLLRERTTKPLPPSNKVFHLYKSIVAYLRNDQIRAAPSSAPTEHPKANVSAHGAEPFAKQIVKDGLRLLRGSFPVLFAAVPCSADAAAWVQKPGEGLVIYSVDTYRSSKAWDDDGHSQSSPTYRKLEFNPYLEYGVTDKTTVGANAFLLHVQQDGSGRNSGLGDVELFVRRLLHTDGWDSLSTQLLVKIPGGYDKNAVLPLGAGQVDVEARILYGRGGVYETSAGEKKSWYYNVEAAYRKRFDGPVDELHIDLTAAWRPVKPWTVEIKQGNIMALESTPTTTATTVNRWSDYDLHKVTVDAIYEFSPTLSSNFGVSYDFMGRNAGQGISPFVAIWQRI